MSAITGFDFKSRVDICGGNMWVWHRKMAGTDGLIVIKQGIQLDEAPRNWKDHIQVIRGRKRRITPSQIPESDIDIFEELCGRYPRVTLDNEHKKLIKYLEDNECQWWWDADHHMLITHTFHLKEAYNDISCRGFFDTVATGAERGADHNCFLYPLRRGAWTARRYTPGVQEHASWDQDGSGWTRCYYNRDTDFPTACRSKGGLEDQNGSFLFREAEQAEEAARLLNVELNLPPAMMGRETTLKMHKSGRLVAEVIKTNHDTADGMSGWFTKGGKPWSKLFNIQATNTPIESEIGNFDDLSRHLTTESGEDYGWVIKADGAWRNEPLSHIKLALQSLGYKTAEVTEILGSSVFRAWIIVNKPFQLEYPGGREWNRNAAQFRFKPKEDKSELNYPHWRKILEHCGYGLNEAIKESGWAKANGIISGEDYLKCWIASLFQEPTEPLPYLFLWGAENSGKSILHEALSLLMTKGYQKADLALTSQSGFNGELEGAICCVVEEVDLSASRTALNRIKDWVTAPSLNIRHMYRTPYHIPNTTHWIQCANKPRFCPVFPGDTRITMIFVENLDPLDLIPKRKLLHQLQGEAPDFLAAIMDLEIPASNDRLNVPVIGTIDKSMAQELNQTELERFISEKCRKVPGRRIKFSNFYDKFEEWADPDEIRKWSKIRVGREIQLLFPKGRQRKDGQYYIGNICWANLEDLGESGPRLTIHDSYLEPIEE
jgi:hypothetical protein